MAKAYRNAWSEMDQIKGVETGLMAIAGKFSSDRSCDKMWKHIVAWEFLERAGRTTVRGHARHVLNVFWMGYYLLNCAALRERIIGIANSGMWLDGSANFENILEAWFYASIFHDVGGIIEHQSSLRKKIDDIGKLFGSLRVRNVEVGENIGENTLADLETSKMGNDLLTRFSDSEALISLWNVSLKSGRPDHGVVSGMLLSTLVPRPASKVAAEAMSVHNLIGEATASLVIRWDSHPIAALLTLCDQLQTWDRERGDATHELLDRIDHAELADIEILDGDSRKPTVIISINYLGDRKIATFPPLRSKIESQLTRVLRSYPITNIRKIGGDWPFIFIVRFFLNGREINPIEGGVKFGENSADLPL